MAATHDTIIQIQILLDPPPAGVSGFIPIIVGDAEEGTTLDGDRVRSYTSADDVDGDSAHLSAYVADAVKRGFSQTPRPAVIKVGRKADTESFAEALSEIADVDGDFYGIAIESRLPADQIDSAEWAEARDHIFVFQSDDEDWLAAGIPADYATIEGFENTAGLYHDRPERSEEFSWLCNRLAFSPDDTSAPWDCALNASQGYQDDLSTSEKTFAEGNKINLLLPFGNARWYVACEGVGVNLAGRQISEIVTKHWFKRRLQESVAQTKIAYSGRGQKIPVSLEGVAIIAPLVEALFAQGEATGHFVGGQTVVDFPIPTAADIEAARIRGGGSAQLTTSAGKFEFTLVFSRQPVVEVEG